MACLDSASPVKREENQVFVLVFMFMKTRKLDKKENLKAGGLDKNKQAMLILW